MEEYDSLAFYQEGFIRSVRRVLGGSWLRRHPAVSILDMGCDTSGRQLREFSLLTRGEVVGVNVADGFPSAAAFANAGNRVSLLNMDGMRLSFPDHSFDFVISANVLEHVPDPGLFLSEAARVLKPTGLCYMETAPVWTSARGHHIMESMIERMCPLEWRFIDDGSVIPEWGHLQLNRSQMQQHLLPRLQKETVDYIIHYLYDSGDLNKWSWGRLKAAIHHSFPFVRIAHWSVPVKDSSMMPADGQDDYSIYGFSFQGRLRPESWLKRRICWRLRRLGL